MFATLLDWSTFSIRIAEVGGSQAGTGASISTMAPSSAQGSCLWTAPIERASL